MVIVRSCVVVEVDEAAALVPGARRRVDGHAHLLEPLARAAAALVVGERGVELGAAGELGELHGGHGAAAAHVLPPLGGVQDLAGARHVRHARELDPLDVADDGDPGHARRGAAANSRMPASKSSAARKPSRSAAAVGGGEHVPHVARPPLAGDHRLGPVEGARERARHVQHGARRAARDVVGARLGVEREQVGAGDVADVHEVAPLAAVLEHARRGAGGQRGPEDARHPGVGRVAGHPRTVDVVVAQRRHGGAGLAGERGAQVLLGELGRRVDVAGVGGRVLGHRLRLERRAAVRAGRLEAAAVEVGGRARRRAHHAVLRAGVAALAVDDHARSQHQPAGEAAGGERLEQHRGAEVVVGDVVGDVADVGSETDHRRLVADGGDAGHRAGDRAGVADVALDPLCARVHVLRPLAVGGGQQHVQHAHLVAGLEQRVDHVRADEAGAAGDEDRSIHGAGP